MNRRRLSPGHLRHRITIESIGTTADGRGGNSSSTPTTHATVYARVAPLSARESYLAGQVQGAVSHRITLRYISGVTPSMRVSWDSRVFTIQGVRNVDEADRVLELDVTEERI